MFRRFYVQKVLCSENICSKGSMFRRFNIQKVLCSEGPMFRKKLFKRAYIQKVLCSEGPIFRYVQKVLYSEKPLFYVGTNLLVGIKLKCGNKSQHFILDQLMKYQMSLCHAVLSIFIRPQFSKIAIAPQISKTQNGS